MSVSLLEYRKFKKEGARTVFILFLLLLYIKRLIS